MPSPVEEDAKHIRPCVPGCLCKRSLGSSKLLLWHILCIVLLPFWHILFIVLLPLSSKVQMITWCALLGPGNSFHTCCNLTCNSTSVVKNHTHACTHARTHARMHARTHAHTHTHARARARTRGQEFFEKKKRKHYRKGRTRELKFLRMGIKV